MDDVLDAVEDDRPGRAGVEEALDPQHVLAAGLQEHRQPDAERRPVERLLERECEGVHVVVAAVRAVRAGLLTRPNPGRIDRRPPPEQPSRMEVAARGRRHLRRRVEGAHAFGHGPGVGEIGLRDHEAVGSRHLASPTLRGDRAFGCRRRRRRSRRRPRGGRDDGAAARRRASPRSAQGRRDRSSRRRPGETGAPRRGRAGRAGREAPRPGRRAASSTRSRSPAAPCARRPDAAGGGRSRPRRAR